MGPRRPFVGGNWKMHGDRARARALAEGLVARRPAAGVDIVVFPPFVHLDAVHGRIEKSSVALGAQDVYFEREGAFTGEVSAPMLLDAGCAWALTGHSERRHVVGESDDLVGRKTRAALDAGLACVLCIGETLDEREAGETDQVNERQLRAGLHAVDRAWADRLVVAYEPVWAIGTGRTASPDDAQNAHERIRTVLAEILGDAGAEVRIVYGGSVKPDNAADLFSQPDIDGGLIGGASLHIDQFLAICAEAARAGSASGGVTR
ncbi:MAG: triose-phosphate isomerase [Phycisphaerales bacterium]